MVSFRAKLGLGLVLELELVIRVSFSVNSNPNPNLTLKLTTRFQSFLGNLKFSHNLVVMESFHGGHVGGLKQ